MPRNRETPIRILDFHDLLIASITGLHQDPLSWDWRREPCRNDRISTAARPIRKQERSLWDDLVVPRELRQHVAVYDYGMGGIWVLIEAESPEAVESRCSWLRVVRIGDPPWITPKKYREIAQSWIGKSMQFEFEPA
jgi:hypothetical protein